MPRLDKKCILITILVIAFLFVFKKYIINKKDAEKGFFNEPSYDYNSEFLNRGPFLTDTLDNLIWFVQISDLHLSEFHDKTRIKDFENFCKEILGLIKPKVVLASGDLTDAKNKDHTGSKQYESEWKEYNRVLNENQNTLKDLVWLDVRGNHDNFDVPARNSELNFFKRYGVQGENSIEHSYLREIKTPDGAKYSFIAVDASIEPGPRRPFNFFGYLNEKDLLALKKFNSMSKESNGTIWFGHFPTSTIYSSNSLRKIMTNGAAYLSGHLHTFGGLVRAMYTRHLNGMLELELADWKFTRMFRILAFDGGLFSFRDFQFQKELDNNDMYILITNPKSLQFKVLSNREPLRRMFYSSHIRFLVFAKQKIETAQVFVDNLKIGQAKQQQNSPLFALEWKAKDYEFGVHVLKVIVEDSDGKLATHSIEFSLDNSVKSFKFLPSLILMNDHIYFTRLFFYSITISIISIMLFFRFNRKRFVVSFIPCNLIRTVILGYFRRFALLSSIDYIFWMLIFSTVYVAVGPWFVGEILENSLGLCFVWGIYVNGAFLNVDFQYIFGSFHMLFFQLLLIFHLSFQIETRFLTINFHQESETSSNLSPQNSFKLYIKKFLPSLWANFSFLFLVSFCLLQMYDFYLSYSFYAIIFCPLKTWMLIVSIYLRNKCANLNANDFEKFLHDPASKYNTVYLTNAAQLSESEYVFDNNKQEKEVTKLN